MRTVWTFPLALFIFPLLAQATPKTAATPCEAPQQKQFDFWIGEWDLTWPGEKPGEVGHGTNSIKRILDGCIVQETFFRWR